MGSVGSLFGGSESESQSSSASGYNAMPKIQQEAYDPFFRAVKSLWETPVSAFPKAMATEPKSIFDSLELYKLQQANPNTPLVPTGYLEPFNQYQKSALTSMGQPDYSLSGLSQYLNPYQQLVQQSVIDNINRQSAIDRSNLLDNNSRLNSRANSSSIGTQLALNNEAKNRLMADALANLGYQGYNSALDLRNQSLQQQLGAGGAIQQQNQALLSASNPQGQIALNPQFLQASMFSPLYQYFPQAQESQSTSESSSGGNMFSQLGGLGLAIFGGKGK